MSLQVVLDESFEARVETVTDASPLDPHQVRVQVACAGLNFWEVLQRRGRAPIPASRRLGTEGAGVVQEVGAAVTDFRPGQRVAWSRVPGSFAEAVVAPATALVSVPQEVDDAAAGALLFQGQTASYLCHHTWPLERGETAVVTAAAGGVGQLLSQLLSASGVRVIGVVSSEAKTDAARAAGASDVLLYGDGLAEDVRALAPGGVSAVYDAVGAGVAEPLLRTLRPRGAMVLYGSASGRDADISAKDLGAGSFYLTRTAGRDYLGTDEQMRATGEQLLQWVIDGTVRPTIGATYPLAEVGRALDDLESRRTIGKVLLRP
ncbi:quinone oxidoreductase [Nocardioides aquiterrae]|uniref:Quinone oxidoreductase n=2 Tax=Nocardioides aquiterrae TaxID=203799 RepID=A0ABN1UG63_9ACTN